MRRPAPRELHSAETRVSAPLLLLVALGLGACGDRAAPAATRSAEVPSAVSGSPSAAPPAAPAPPQATLAIPLPKVLAADLWGAYAVEGAVLVVRDDGTTRTIARVDGDRLVDEPGLLTGLPPPETMFIDGAPRVPVGIMALAGRWPSPLVLQLGRGLEFSWDGRRWMERERRDGDRVFFARPEWQSGRGMLFNVCNTLEGCQEWPSHVFDPLPAAFPRPLDRSARTLYAQPMTGSAHTWVGQKGTRATLVLGDSSNRLLIDGRPPSSPRADFEHGVPVYVRGDGTVVTGVQDSKKDARFPEAGRRAAYCDKSGCKQTEPATSAISFLREIGGQLYAFTSDEHPMRVHRLDGTRWVELRLAGLEDSLWSPVGDGDRTSVLLVMNNGSQKLLARWSP